MPSCVVKSCRNHSRFVNKQHGITFHRFPGDKKWRLDWVRIIRESRNENGWNPTKSSVACSVHFDDKDIYATKGGLRRVVKYAVPKKFLLESPSFQENDAPEVGISNALHEVDGVLHESSSSIEAITGHEQTLEQSCSQNLNSSLLEPPRIQEKQANEADTFCLSHIIHQQRLEQSCSQNLNSSLLEPPRIQEKQANEADTFCLSHNIYKQRLEKACSQNSNSSLNQSSPKAVSPDDTDMEQTLSQLYTTKQRHMKNKLIKMHILTQNQKKKIKLLNQKVRRLENRNKRLKDIVKTFKKNNYIILK